MKHTLEIKEDSTGEGRVYNLQWKDTPSIVLVGEIYWHEDAQRIVACVNALEGYTTKNIEGVDFKSNHDSLCDLLSIAIAERDKERAVKGELLKHIEDNMKCGCSECQNEMDLIKRKAEKGGNNETYKESE